MAERNPVRYFADENALGFAKILVRSGRGDVVHPGHPLIPAIPLGSDDADWLEIAGRRHWIVLSRERRIRSRPAELEIYLSFGVRSVWLGGKRDMGPQPLADLFTRSELRLQRIANRLGAGPWAVAMTPSGVRQLRLRER